MPARNGAWKRFGSVAVTQFQRSVWRNAANWRGASKPLAARSLPALLLEDAAVELVVPVTPRAPGPGRRRRRRRDGPAETGRAIGGLDDLLDEPAPRADLDELADLRIPDRCFYRRRLPNLGRTHPTDGNRVGTALRVRPVGQSRASPGMRSEPTDAGSQGRT